MADDGVTNAQLLRERLENQAASVSRILAAMGSGELDDGTEIRMPTQVYVADATGALIPITLTAIGSISTSIVDSDGTELKLDGASGSVSQVDHAHHKIHEGEYWSNVQTVSVASTESAYLAIKAGSAKQPHVWDECGNGCRVHRPDRHS